MLISVLTSNLAIIDGKQVYIGKTRDQREAMSIGHRLVAIASSTVEPAGSTSSLSRRLSGHWSKAKVRHTT